MDLRNISINEISIAEKTAKDLTVSRDAEVLERCASAKRHEVVADYEAARSAFGDLWRRIGDPPKLEGLQDFTCAELLLRVGTLTGRIGRVQQLKGAQEIAKDLISHSARIFEKLELIEKVAETRIDLALCYGREGALDEALITLREALQILGSGENEQRLRAIIHLSTYQRNASRFEDALRLQIETAPIFDRSSDHILKGSFHNERALVYKNLAGTEGRPDYVDRSFIEFAAAGYHYEQADHTESLAVVENNLGFLFLSEGKLIEAHQHLNRARALFVKLKDKGSLAEVDDTRARAFLAQGLNAQAETTVRASVRILEEGDQLSRLAEALTTHGTALAGLGRFERALAQFKKAIEVARRAGFAEKEGLAALAIVETLSSYVPPAGIREYYSNAEALLAHSQSPGIENRLGKSARVLLRARAASAKTSMILEPAAAILSRQPGANPLAGGPQPDGSVPEWEGCSLENEVLRYEGEMIQRALEASRGSVTRAARMLGITHQGLAFILNGRHKSLLTVRTPVRRRRKSIFRNH